MARPNHPGLLPFFLTVKPFAYVVRYYACQNGKDKGNEKLHYTYLLPVASIGNGNSLIIAYTCSIVHGNNIKTVHKYHIFQKILLLLISIPFCTSVSVVDYYSHCIRHEYFWYLCINCTSHVSNFCDNNFFLVSEKQRK